MTGTSEAIDPSQTKDRELARECRLFARYLVGVEATDYVVGKYVGAHEALPALATSDRFDRLLLRLGRGPGPLRWPAAAFARVHYPASALQNKLVTLLAILETAPESGAIIDTVPSTSVPWLVLRLGVRGALAALSLVAGTVVLLPLKWALSASTE